MVEYISFDMDGTLVDAEFTDWVWGHGIPTLYSQKFQISFEEAKASVEREYQKVGEGAIEWYDIKHWLRFFGLDTNWRALMQKYADKIKVYPDVSQVLDRMQERFPLILTSNAGREFIEVEMTATGLERYFRKIFSATSDFRLVKKIERFYRGICEILDVEPERIVHVGDHYEFDFLVPRKVGIQAFYLDRSGQKEGDSIIRSLAELEERVTSGR